jgi:hypothetical protein
MNLRKGSVKMCTEFIRLRTLPNSSYLYRVLSKKNVQIRRDKCNLQSMCTFYELCESKAKQTSSAVTSFLFEKELNVLMSYL